MSDTTFTTVNVETAGGLKVAGVAITATPAELNYLDVATAGVAEADKAVILGATKNIATITSATITTLTSTTANVTTGNVTTLASTTGNVTTVNATTVNATNIDAGASGTAGTVDVFPTTASKGKLALSVTDQTGDTTVGMVIGAMAAARTITLADPLANADILTGKMAAVARTATGDGLTTAIIADAGMIQFVAVTSAGAGDIIVLPTPTPGRIVILYVGANGFELRSSAPASVAINGGTDSAGESAIAASMMAVAICTSATSWHGFTITAATLAALEAAAN